jgi:hypothetical protein
LTRKVDGKTVTKVIPIDFVDAAVEQINRYREVQRLWHEYTEVNVKICEALIHRSGGESEGPEGAKKGGSSPNSGSR